MKDIDAALLMALNQGPQSGSSLGEALGISRVAIQKRLAALRAQGLPLNAVAGSGYQLEPGVHLLDAENIRRHLVPEIRAQVTKLEILQQTPSTNLWVQGQSLASHRAVVCLAEAQLAGRGRRGAGWVATPYRNLLFSLGWRFPVWPASLPGLSLVAGLVSCQALELLGIEGVQIKWPNDLYRNGAKLGGILVQASGEASGPCDVVIGLGLNLLLRPAERQAIDQPASDLSDLDNLPDRNELAALLIEGLVEMLPLFAEQGFSLFRDAWRERALYLEQPVSVLREGVAEVGRFIDVNEQGALLFRREGGETLAFTEAEISLRPI